MIAPWCSFVMHVEWAGIGLPTTAVETVKRAAANESKYRPMSGGTHDGH